MVVLARAAQVRRRASRVEMTVVLLRALICTQPLRAQDALAFGFSQSPPNR